MFARRLPLVCAAVLIVVSCATRAERTTPASAGPVPERAPERVEEVPEAWNLDGGPVFEAELVERVTVPVPSRWSSSAEAFALFEGRVHRYSNADGNASGLGRFVELEHVSAFTVGGETQKTRFHTVYAGLGGVSVEPDEHIGAGSPVGTMSDGETGLRIAVFTTRDDPVWRRQTGRPPIEIDGYYFWDPSFVLSPP